MVTGFISADAHVTEPIELYAERVGTRFRDRVPRIVEADGWRTLHAESTRPRKLMPAGELELAVVGGPDPEARRREQAQDGVVAEVVFPNWALNTVFVGDPDLQFALAAAYNDWASEHLNTVHRSLPVAMIPLADVEGAIAEAQRCASLGFRALSLPARVEQADYNSDVYDPFWSCVVELGLPLTFHSGTGYEPRIAGGRGAHILNYVLAAQSDGPRVLLHLSAGGVLERFPDLQVVTVETGASWLAWVMTQADEVYVDHAKFAREQLPGKPSEYIKRQCAATFMVDPVAVRNRDITGVDTLIWGNDYPHPEGTWPQSADTATEQFAEVDDADRQAITFANAARVFGFEPERL